MSSSDEKDLGVVDTSPGDVDPKEDTVVVAVDTATNTFNDTSKSEIAGENMDLKAKILAKLEAKRLDDDNQDNLIGEEIAGRFTVMTRIGEGGMGVVYKARQKNMDRDVAIKVLLAEMAANKTVEKRFYLEALAVSKLKHPNTIQIHDFGETEKGQLYIAMEFLDGAGLKDILKDEKTLAAKRAARVSVQILRSLREAHAKGIVHRDLKPDNVFLCTVGDEVDFVKVLDFGVAKLKEGDESNATLTKTGAIFGTPRYMSPEQSVSANVDHRSDLYAIGVMLYEMLTGRAPFEAEMPLSLLIMHVQDPVPAFGAVRPDLVIPPELETFTRKLLEKEADKRHATAEAAIRELEDLIEGMDDIYRNVVTTDYAEKIGLEIASPVVTMSNTMLNPSHAQLERTMVSDGTEIIARGDSKKGSAKWLVLGLILLLGGVAAVVATQSSSEPDAPANAEKPAVVAEAPKVDVKPQTIEEADVVTASPDVIEEITLKIASDPPGAIVWEGDTKLGPTPYESTRPRSADGEETEWRLSLEGYQDKTIRFEATANLNQSVALVKARKVRSRPPKTRVKVPVEKPTVVVKDTPVVPKPIPKPKPKPKPKPDPFEFNKVNDTKGLD